jgi:hypothetical protein
VPTDQRKLFGFVSPSNTQAVSKCVDVQDKQLAVLSLSELVLEVVH